MSKVITSPVKQFPGTVTLTEPLFLPQVEAIEEALNFRTEDEKVFVTVLDKKNFPAILTCVEKWDLQNVPNPPTLETFPMSPRPASHALLEWLWREIRNVYIGEAEIPNE